MSKKFFYSLFLLVTLCGCQDGPLTADDSDVLDREARRDKRLGKLFGDDFFTLWGGSSSSSNTQPAIGVNEFLWRASLDTVSFMPLRTTDPFGGVILSEWYTPAKTPNERLKVDILILNRELSASSVRVAIHKQIMNTATKQWVDHKVADETVREFEDAILTRARQLKIKGRA